MISKSVAPHFDIYSQILNKYVEIDMFNGFPLPNQYVSICFMLICAVISMFILCQSVQSQYLCHAKAVQSHYLVHSELCSKLNVYSMLICAEMSILQTT